MAPLVRNASRNDREGTDPYRFQEISALRAWIEENPDYVFSDEEIKHAFEQIQNDEGHLVAMIRQNKPSEEKLEELLIKSLSYDFGTTAIVQALMTGSGRVTFSEAFIRQALNLWNIPILVQLINWYCYPEGELAGGFFDLEDPLATLVEMAGEISLKVHRIISVLVHHYKDNEDGEANDEE